MSIKNILNIIKSLHILNDYPDVDKSILLEALKTSDLIDKKIVGRYCGRIGDRLTQMISCASVIKKYPNTTRYAHLEIGVLFGGSIIARAKILELKKSNHSLIAIDPFKGFYSKRMDPLSRQKVTLTIFKKNIDIFGLKDGRIVIIKKYSNDKKILKSISHYKIISIMLDGDHSYNGVKSDWEMYTPVLQKGGYLLIDNYQDPRWPSVTRCVDDQMNKEKSNWVVKSKQKYSLVLEKQ